MKEVDLVNIFFSSLEQADTQSVLDICDDHMVIVDPFIGQIWGDKARHYYCSMAVRYTSLQFDTQTTYLDPFRAVVKWRAMCSIRNNLVIRNGITNFEFKEGKIYRIINQHNFFSLLNSYGGPIKFMLQILPYFKNKSQKKVLSMVEEYIIFRNRIGGNRSVL